MQIAMKYTFNNYITLSYINLRVKFHLECVRLEIAISKSIVDIFGFFE